ncbi:hypothetical protein FRC06_007054 [Ceratobasidium sp. 370]|nr:hypothetical protein FRC06_007054 [Ceratobasidium sp. 370]
MVLVSEEEFGTWSRQLDQFGRSESGPNMNATFSVARINQVLAERRIPYYYNTVSEDGGFVRGLLAGILGLFAPRQNRQPPLEHPEEHADSPGSSIASTSSPPSSPSSSGSLDPGSFFTPLSASMNGAAPPALLGLEASAANHSPTHPLPQT